MPAASQLRAEIESFLAHRIPSALSPAPRSVRPTSPTGIADLDELLGGGLPVGAISELVGPECSGRTSIALSFLAQIIREGKVCAWVDVSDALDPESAAAAGIDLDRLLWVRCGCGEARQPTPAAEENLETTTPPNTSRTQLGGNSPHPRQEANGLPAAIGDLLGTRKNYRKDKTVGTPGAANRRLGMSTYEAGSIAGREEQIASDRQPKRRGEFVLEQREAYEPRCAKPQRKPRPEKRVFAPATDNQPNATQPARTSQKLWSRLDQALRATDLLLQGGGFSAIVLDMGSIAPEFALRVPLATWFRYRGAVERTQSSLLLLTQHPCAKSSAGLVLNFAAASPADEIATVFSGFRTRVEPVRQRFRQEADVLPLRKPPQRAEAAVWHSRTAWAGQK